ncbi:MOSC domain-containing protein [Streptomyces sp. NPDC050418]|uniref:MOSC domain-containing protein n=1 Tax=Streptomyces sp. NPDC050418 TaxID=3365612 RepID=UPI00379B055A
MKLLSLNAGRSTPVPYTDHASGRTGIDKLPVDGPVRVAAPGRQGVGGPSGIAGDAVCDQRVHGGDDQAVYAFAREDLDGWERQLGRSLRNGAFGENLTTSGLDVSGALIGERWRIGADVVLEVTSARIPCNTFAGQTGEKGWVKRFTLEGAPGAYLRVIEPGEITAGDPIEIVHRPDHDITVAFLFRAATVDKTQLGRVLVAGDALSAQMRESAEKYKAKYGG